jgi:hypothetical protein
MTRRVASKNNQYENGSEHHVRRGQLVDVENAIDEIIVIIEEIEDRNGAEDDQAIVEQRRRCPVVLRQPAIDEEDERQREQQMRAAIDDGLGRAEGDRVHMIERHGDGDGHCRQPHDAAMTQIKS